jgi:hypothetical protein
LNIYENKNITEISYKRIFKIFRRIASEPYIFLYSGGFYFQHRRLHKAFPGVSIYNSLFFLQTAGDNIQGASAVGPSVNPAFNILF